MNRQTNKFHCDLPHPTKGEPDQPFDSDKIAKQIEHDMLIAFVQIVKTHNSMLAESAKQSSPPAPAKLVDSHASEVVEEQDLD